MRSVRYHHYLQHNLPFKPICPGVRAGAGPSLHTTVVAMVATLALPLHKMSDPQHARPLPRLGSYSARPANFEYNGTLN